LFKVKHFHAHVQKQASVTSCYKLIVYSMSAIKRREKTVALWIYTYYLLFVCTVNIWICFDTDPDDVYSLRSYEGLVATP